MGNAYSGIAILSGAHDNIIGSLANGPVVSGADFNCDGSVDVLDLDILIRNFDSVGDS